MLRIKELRQQRGLTQLELGQAAKINTATISRLEGVDADPRISTLESIAKVLGVTARDLIASEAIPTPETPAYQTVSHLIWTRFLALRSEFFPEVSAEGELKARFDGFFVAVKGPEEGLSLLRDSMWLDRHQFGGV